MTTVEGFATTVEDFLGPPLGPLELGHVVVVKMSEHVQRRYDPANISGKAQKTRDADNSRFAPLADVREKWSAFDVERISAHPSIAASLSRPCAVEWEPQVPRFARIVYSERQLEALFLQTLITRVNIALDKAIPANEERIAILVGPGAFESVSAEASVQRLIPDWIVVQGDFDVGMKADSLPVLKDVATQGRILAVGDTKLVRKGGGIGNGNVPYTKACHHDFLRQLQEYCLNLYTRFGFILSNEELVVLQVMAAQEASPRKAEQRGLRSNGEHQPESSLDSRGTDSFDSMDQDGDDSPMSGLNGRNEDPYEYGLPPLLSPSDKRPHPSTSPETSPIVASSRRFQNASGSLSGSDSSSHQMNSHPIGSYQVTSHQVTSHQVTSHRIPSSPVIEASQASSSSQSYSRYTPSVRDVEVGAIQIQSFDMKGWGEEGKEGDSPYRALFMFVMMIRALKLQQLPIHISLQEQS
ncbi:uncharacterized protein Triagg1_878 [Trichoderma aggressivum f. europaeum]|uniref:Uncharacterized protein n=1 Tax=Trichoderma aggressivum f. europaeum TaxID=173218 RepID=A0AAE1IJ97_9HYPO|nr:hypothetical protein Triagg1_878 [Trichoderma aggressivum f. europaeum]